MTDNVSPNDYLAACLAAYRAGTLKPSAEDEALLLEWEAANEVRTMTLAPIAKATSA